MYVNADRPPGTNGASPTLNTDYSDQVFVTLRNERQERLTKLLEDARES